MKLVFIACNKKGGAFMNYETSKFTLRLVREENYDYNGKISSPESAYELIVQKLELDQMTEEVFCILGLDVKNQVIGVMEVSRGTLSASLVHPREVFKRALLMNASKIFLAHNHPSGVVDPSREDKSLTKKMEEAGSLLGIEVLDHIIVGNCESSNFYSFKEDEKM